MKEVRIAIVGMGIGRHNAGGFVRNARSRVVALCDLVEEKMVEFAAELPDPVQLYTDYHEMCRNPDIDAVFVGTPNQFHVPVALAAVRSGKHVMVTKPLADSMAAATELVDAAEAAGVVNMMSLSTRFAPAVQYLGQLTQAGDLGDLYYARGRSVRRSGIPSWSLGFVRAGGGAFRDMGVHALDTAWWLLGQPKPVSVLGVAGAKFGPFGKGFWDFAEPPPEMVSEYAADDYAGGFIRFENDMGMQIESFWASHQPDDFGIELFGTDAGAQLWPLKLYRTVNGKPQTTEVDMVTGDRGQVSWDAVAEHFVASILDGIECQAPLRHGMMVQEMMEALLESAKTGREVRLDKSP